MNWRSLHGMGDKPFKRCAVCGVEVKANQLRCGHHRGDLARTAYHAAYDRENAYRLRPIAAERMRKQRERNRLKRTVIRALCEGIDQGRQEAYD